MNDDRPQAITGSDITVAVLRATNDLCLVIVALGVKLKGRNKLILFDSIKRRSVLLQFQVHRVFMSPNTRIPISQHKDDVAIINLVGINVDLLIAIKSVGICGSDVHVRYVVSLFLPSHIV